MHIGENKCFAAKKQKPLYFCFENRGETTSRLFFRSSSCAKSICFTHACFSPPSFSNGRQYPVSLTLLLPPFSSSSSSSLMYSSPSLLPLSLPPLLPQSLAGSGGGNIRTEAYLEGFPVGVFFWRKSVSAVHIFLDSLVHFEVVGQSFYILFVQYSSVVYTWKIAPTTNSHINHERKHNRPCQDFGGKRE